MKGKILLVFLGVLAVIVGLPLAAAFEAHVVNVTARIENALYVHPQSLQFGTVFPQEHLFSSFFIAFSESFSAANQNRVGTVEYVIKQKPRPREAFLAAMGTEAARDWCHLNAPADANNPNDPYYTNCYPTMCSALSKHPDNHPSTGPNANNDVGLPPFHNPEIDFATGKIVKFNQNGSTVGNDPADTWDVDLAVPCFRGQCAQDWADFVHGLNPNAGDPRQYVLPPNLEHETFACDLWVEVTSIH